MGKVDFGGVLKEVCLDFVPDLIVGDYTIVHVGFALSKIDEATALETLEMFREIGALEEELGPSDTGPPPGSGPIAGGAPAVTNPGEIP